MHWLDRCHETARGVREDHYQHKRILSGSSFSLINTLSESKAENEEGKVKENDRSFLRPFSLQSCSFLLEGNSNCRYDNKTSVIILKRLCTIAVLYTKSKCNVVDCVADVTTNEEVVTKG